MEFSGADGVRTLIDKILVCVMWLQELHTEKDVENKELREQLKEMERQRKEQEESLQNLRKFFFSSSKAEQVTKVKVVWGL